MAEKSHRANGIKRLRLPVSAPREIAEPTTQAVSARAANGIGRHWLALVLFPLLAAGFLGDVLFTPRNLSGFDTLFSHAGWQWQAPAHIAREPALIDSPTAHYPQRRLEWDAFRQGQNIDFNPYIFAGMPVSPQGPGAFITSLPQLVADIPSAIDWSTWIRLALAGLLMYAFCVFAGLSRGASLLGGVVWAYNLHQIVWLQFPQHLATQLWMPLLLLLCLSIIRDGPRRENIAGLMLANVLFFTSGYLQGVLYTYLMLGAFNTVYLLAQPGPGALERLRRWLAVHGALLVSLAVVGLEAAMHTQAIDSGLRGAQHWRTPEAVDLSLSTVLTFITNLVPGLGELTVRYYTPHYWGGLWAEQFASAQPTNLVESGGYFGIVALFFVFLSALALLRRSRHALLIAVVVPMLLAFAVFQRDPLAVAGMGLIPMGDRGNYSRMLTLLTFCASILAAIGLDAFVRWLRPGWSLRLWLTALAFAVPPVLAWWLWEDFRVSRLFYPAAIMAVFVFAATVVVRWLPVRRLLPALAIVIVTADLFNVGYTFNTRLDNAVIFPRNDTINYLLADHEPLRVATIAEKHIYHPNTLSYYRIPIIEGYSTVAPVGYLDFLRTVFMNTHVTHNGIVFLHDAYVPGLRMLGVHYVLSDQILDVDGLDHVFFNDGAHMHRLTDPLPRLYCATHAEIERDPHRTLREMRTQLDRHDRPLVVAEAAGPLGALEGGCQTRNTEIFTSRIEFSVDAERPGWVAIPYSFSPNWRAQIADTDVPVIRANYNFMAIPIPAGSHDVVLRWDNRGQRLAAVALIAGAVLLLIALVIKRWHPTARVLIAIGAVAVIGKSAYSLPPLYNDRIPENPKAEVTRSAITTAGIVRTAHRRPSPQIRSDQPFETTFISPKPGLSAVALKLATYEQRELEHALVLTLYADDGDEPLSSVTYPPGDARIDDIVWLWLEFPPLDGSADRTYRLTLTVPEASRRPLSVWLTGDDEPALITLHTHKAAPRVETKSDGAHAPEAGVD